jgi:hypothetical protein
MDLIEGLPLPHGSTVILVVDRFTKYGHFLSLSHPYKASKVAQIFLANVLKLHGMPKTIVSDEDPFGESCFIFKVSLSHLALPIIPNRMAK